MSKAVLISIRPKWCELIASGKKTIEVRKTRPKIETPFKCYIYCTKSSSAEKLLFLDFYGGTPKPGWVFPINRDTALRMGMVPMNGMVIGEFVCDRIYGIVPDENGWGEEYGYSEHDCLSDAEMAAYLGDHSGFGWHISDLVIYDEPKKLSEFTGLRNTKFGYAPYEIIRPPQSWCYVEELP